MYNVIKFKDNSFLATKKSVNYFRAEEEPELVATEIEDFNKAIELEKWFSRPINTLFDKIAKPPFLFKEGSVAVGSDDFIF